MISRKKVVKIIDICFGMYVNILSMDLLEEQRRKGEILI